MLFASNVCYGFGIVAVSKKKKRGGGWSHVQCSIGMLWGGPSDQAGS